MTLLIVKFWVVCTRLGVLEYLYEWTTDDDCTGMHTHRTNRQTHTSTYNHQRKATASSTVQSNLHTYIPTKFRAYIRVHQGVEIIKGAWRARGCLDDGHVNQHGRQDSYVY